jgi:1-phosphatidylinositol-4-phosphate 5-kinase
VAGLALVFIYISVSVYTIWYFQKTVPDNPAFATQKKDFLNYYFNYILASCIIWTVLAISNLLSGLNCEYFQKSWLDASITLGNAAKLATPIVLSILRYHDPTIKKKIMRLIKQVFRPKHRTDSHLSSGS